MTWPPDWMTEDERKRCLELFGPPASISEERAIAVVNHGRWIARCPRRHCFNAMKLAMGQQMFHCGTDDGCQLVVPIEWPANAQEIWDELQRRPVPGTRNWAPAGHPQAVATGHPDGQSVDELRAEADRHLSEGV